MLDAGCDCTVIEWSQMRVEGLKQRQRDPLFRNSRIQRNISLELQELARQRARLITSGAFYILFGEFDAAVLQMRQATQQSHHFVRFIDTRAGMWRQGHWLRTTCGSKIKAM